MVKYILILFVIVIGYFIATGSTGGSKKATGNYVKTMRGG